MIRKIKKILFLDEDIEFGKKIKTNLESNGFHVTIVSNFAELRNATAHQIFDLFVIDYDIPDDRNKNESLGGGLKSVTYIRKHLGFVPIIIYSGVLHKEIENSNVIEGIEGKIIDTGGTFILQKGQLGSSLAKLVKRIFNTDNVIDGFLIKDHMSKILGERMFDFRITSISSPSKKKGRTVRVAEIEVQKLMDKKKSKYQISFDERNHILSTRIMR